MIAGQGWGDSTCSSNDGAYTTSNVTLDWVDVTFSSPEPDLDQLHTEHRIFMAGVRAWWWLNVPLATELEDRRVRTRPPLHCSVLRGHGARPPPPRVRAPPRALGSNHGGTAHTVPPVAHPSSL